MQSKKGKKLLLITIIAVIILIIVIGICIVYFATDIFKGNKQLFFKYTAQIANNDSVKQYSELTSYFEKKQNTPYTDEGKVSVDINSSDNQEKYENTNNTNITFSGQVDSSNSQTEQNISINYTEDETFPFIYKQVGETIGIQTDFVGSRFVSTNTTLENMLFGNTSTVSIDEMENLKNISFTDEELKHIRVTYVGVLNQQLQENNFSKTENGTEIGYTLTLNQLEIKNIILKLLETLKSDQVTLSKINEYLQQVSGNSQSITTSDIDNVIQSFDQTRN